MLRTVGLMRFELYATYDSNKNALEIWRNGIELRVLNWPACLHSGASVHQQVKYLESFFGAV